MSSCGCSKWVLEGRRLAMRDCCGKISFVVKKRERRIYEGRNLPDVFPFRVPCFVDHEVPEVVCDYLVIGVIEIGS